MSEEMFDVLDKTGEPTGVRKTKNEILAAGDWRLVTHAWLINKKGELLAQRRALKKGMWDGLWDVTVGGGVTAGEDPLHACVRELEEELGLVIGPKELIEAGKFETSKLLPERAITANEFSNTYIVRKEVELEKLQLQEAEVSEVAWVPLDQVGNDTETKLWVPHPKEYYAAIAQKCRELA